MARIPHGILVWALALGLLAACWARGPRRPASQAFQRATQHEQHVWREGSCRQPQPRVLCIKDLQPNDTRKFLPHCAILHRCAPDTGCCSTEDHHCQAKTIQAVRLHFVAILMGPEGDTRYEPQDFIFDNHTECECRLKNEPIR
ncbi:uncharacterized protein LOC135377556 [Ornithodoros turicata]